MSNKVFDCIVEDKIESFILEFEKSSKNLFYDEKTKKLRSPVEYGRYREMIVHKYLRFFIPRFLEMHNGFLITSYNDIGTECDVIVYDKQSTPLIEDNEMQRFFPVETVCAIGEVKSKLTEDQLKIALNKLARNKALRECLPKYHSIIKSNSPLEKFNSGYHHDQITSFLICQKFDFDTSNLVNAIDSFYDADIEKRHRHNMILSLNDGLFTYTSTEVTNPLNGKTLMFPVFGILQRDGTVKEEYLNTRFIRCQNSDKTYIKLFFWHLFMLTSSATIFFPDMIEYIHTNPSKDLFVDAINK